MNDEQVHQVLELDCEGRYDYSLSVIAEEREIWILTNGNNQFLKIYAEDGDFEYLPVWPSELLALHYSAGEQELKPKSISLPEFMKKWIAGLTRDGLEVGVLPGADKSVWITSAEELRQDIQDELATF